MDANGRELILKDEVYAIVSCSIEILNGMGHGLNEKPYASSWTARQSSALPITNAVRR